MGRSSKLLLEFFFRIQFNLIEKISAPKKILVKLRELFTRNPHIFSRSGWTPSGLLNIVSDANLIWSADQMIAVGGSEAINSMLIRNIDFDAIQRGEKVLLLQRLRLICYEVETYHSGLPGGVFAKNVTKEDLIADGMNQTNLPVFVNKVHYGREIVVLTETTSADEQAKSDLLTLVPRFVEVDQAASDYVQSLENVNITMIVKFGKEPEVKTLVPDFGEVRETVKRLTECSKDTPTFPIYFTGIYPARSMPPMVVSVRTDYVEVTKNVYRSGQIRLYHNGWFKVKINVDWEEVSYDEVSNVTWDRNEEDLEATFSQVIQLPGRARNISVSARVAEQEEMIFDYRGLEVIPWREFRVYGTAQAPYVVISSSDPNGNS